MKKLRGAVVGYGFIMDKGHAAGYRQRADVEIVAIADVSRNTPETRYRGLLLERALPSARLMSRTQELLYGDGPCNASQP